MSREVTPISKEDQVARSPGGNRKCPTTGIYKGKCTCPRCLGARNKRKGSRGQTKTRKALGLKSEKWRGLHANEETWHSSNLRVEVKSGKQVQPVATRYVAARNQSDAARPIGDFRPFIFVAVPDGSQPLVVLRADDLRDVVAAFIEEWREA